MTGAKSSHNTHASNFKLQDLNLPLNCRHPGSSKSRNSFTNLHGHKSKKTVDLIIEAPSKYAAEWESTLWKDFYQSRNEVVGCNIKNLFISVVFFYFITYFFITTNKMQLNLVYLFLKVSTYFGQFLRPSSGAHNCTLSLRYCQPILFILTLMSLTWRIWWAHNNASKWQMGFNSAFKVLILNNFMH